MITQEREYCIYAYMRSRPDGLEVKRGSQKEMEDIVKEVFEDLQSVHSNKQTDIIYLNFDESLIVANELFALRAEPARD